jgi:hypothetical protein
MSRRASIASTNTDQSPDEKIAKGKRVAKYVWIGTCSLFAIGGVSAGLPSVFVPFAGAIALVALPIKSWLGEGGDRLPSWGLAAASVGLAAVGFVGVSNAPVQPVAISAPQTEQQLTARIDADAIPTFPASQRDQYPRLFQTLGPRIGEVEGLARQGALTALRSGECDRVTLVGPSDTSTRQSISVYIDCANGARVRLTEAEIRAGSTGSVETAEAREQRAAQTRRDESLLIAQAQINVESTLRDPGSAEFGDAIVTRRDGIVVCGVFNARNGFGGMTGRQRFINTADRLHLQENGGNFDALWTRHC